MRRAFLPVVLAFLALTVSLGAQAAGAASSVDFAVGNGTSCGNPAVCAAPRQFQFSAVSTPSGAHGVYSETLMLCNLNGDCQTGTFKARVLCLSVNGSVATIGAVVTSSSFTLPGVVVVQGNQIVVTAYDGGSTGPDQMSFIVGEPVVEENGQCLNPPQPAQFTVVSGQITVRDGV